MDLDCDFPVKMETPLFSGLESQLQRILQAIVNVDTLKPPAWTIAKTEGTICLQVCWTNINLDLNLQQLTARFGTTSSCHLFYLFKYISKQNIT